MFSTGTIAIVAGGDTTGDIRTRYETQDDTFAQASQGEGLHAQKIGVKSEEHGTAGFSLAAHNKVAVNVLKPLVESIRPLMVWEVTKGTPATAISKKKFVETYDR